MTESGAKFRIANAMLFAFLFASSMATITLNRVYTDESIVRLSALPMVLYWFAWMIHLYIGDGTTKVSRAIATLGLALLIEHVLIAFHLAHGWSHEAAYEHTEIVSGYGFGIWVNYAFVSLWTIDVLWQWLHAASYLRRPRWLPIGVQAFFAFIMLNATVVYGDGVVRWLAALLFLLLAFLLYMVPREPPADGEPL